jgi:hypothetical protein
MLQTSTDGDEIQQRECGKRSVWKHRDGEPCICADCHKALDDEPDIQAEYRHVGMLR